MTNNATTHHPVLLSSNSPISRSPPPPSSTHTFRLCYHRNWNHQLCPPMFYLNLLQSLTMCLFCFCFSFFWVFFLYRLVCQISTKKTQFGVHPVVVKERAILIFSPRRGGERAELRFWRGIFYLFYFFPLGIEPHFVNFSLIILFFLTGLQFV
jgi:hypothetical protein